MSRYDWKRREMVAQLKSVLTPTRSDFGFHLIALAGICAILVITLYPFHFEQFGRIFSFYRYFDGFSAGEYSRCCKHLAYLEPMANIILFTPFGFGIAGLIQRIWQLRVNPFLIVVLVSLTFSFTVEFLQVFQPDRSPSLLDLLMNSLGGGLGYLGYRLYKKLF